MAGQQRDAEMVIEQDTGSRQRTRQSTGDGEEIDDGFWALGSGFWNDGVGEERRQR